LWKIKDFLETWLSTKMDSEKYPIVPEVAKFALHVPYSYDIVYEVWLEWNQDIESTKEAFKLSGFLAARNAYIYPWDITKEYMMRVFNSDGVNKITKDDLKGIKLRNICVKK
jgi:hypothetical protein